MKPGTADDIFADPELTSPAGRFWDITPHDTTPIDPVPRAILIKATGNVVVTDHFGNTVTFSSVPAFTRLDISPRLVKSTGTTASVVALA